MSNVIWLIIDWLKCDFWWSSPELRHSWTFHTGGQNTVIAWSKVQWKDSKSREGLHGYCRTLIIYFIVPEVGKKWTCVMMLDCVLFIEDNVLLEIILSHVLCVFSHFFCISSWVKCTLFSLENCQEWTQLMVMGLVWTRALKNWERVKQVESLCVVVVIILNVAHHLALMQNFGSLYQQDGSSPCEDDANSFPLLGLCLLTKKCQLQWLFSTPWYLCHPFLFVTVRFQ